MAYESKIIIANAHRETNKESEDFGKVYYAEKVMEINLGCMGYNNGWRELFNEEIDFELFIEDEDHSTRTDKYGAVMQEGELESVIQWLENIAPAWWGEKTYRRLPPLLGALKALKPEDWDELHIVHFGY